MQQQIANLLPLENSTLEGANYILTNRPEYTWKPFLCGIISKWK
jgi:hypothetical protein